MINPELILIICEGKTEVIYFNILAKRFRLPTNIKIIPELERYSPLGQHEKLIKRSAEKRLEFSQEFNIDPDKIETWSVFDRDSYKDSFMKLKKLADSLNVNLAFSDPQFENYLLQHFSSNKSKDTGKAIEDELTEKIAVTKPGFGLYNKTDLSWLDEMIDEKHSVVSLAAKNANIFSNHTKQPFFTVQKLIERLLKLL